MTRLNNAYLENNMKLLACLMTMGLIGCTHTTVTVVTVVAKENSDSIRSYQTDSVNEAKKLLEATKPEKPEY